jgi:hypothetical protein
MWNIHHQGADLRAAGERSEEAEDEPCDGYGRDKCDRYQDHGCKDW